MNRAVLLCCFFALVALSIARNPKDRYGILYVNEITANIDTFTVKIEDAFVEDNILRIDIIEEWTGGETGVRSEGIYFNDGNVVLADDFLVNPDTTFPGELYANGGIYANAGLFADPIEDFYSFVVEDNTGKTTFRGLLYVDNGIFSNGNAFVVEATTGETTVRNARTNAYGGIVVNNGEFTADNYGEVFIDSTLHVLETVIIGTNVTEDRYIRRLPTRNQLGGSTFFTAQDGIGAGGNILLVPGLQDESTCEVGGDFSSCDDGQILLGGNENTNIRLTRPFVNAAGGATVFNGQTSPNGDGGDLLFAPGDSNGDGNGGDLIVVPGLSPQGNNGRIYFGTKEDGLASFDLTVGRPKIPFGNGGDTFFVGQHTETGNAGNLNFLAGQGINGGDLYITPGDANQFSGVLEEQGDIVLGNSASSDLVFTRSQALVGAAGDTIYEGQNTGSDQIGGAVYLKAGSSYGGGDGGNLFLLPGTNPGTPGDSGSGVNGGTLFFGDQVNDLTVTRFPMNGGGRDTYIMGQDGAASKGGDLFLSAGNGATIGGDVLVQGGNQVVQNELAFGVGGGVIVEAGEGQLDGGDINIYGADFGDITLSTNSDFAGDIVFNAGAGNTLGDFSVSSTTNSIVFDQTPVVIDGSYLEIQGTTSSVVYRADPINILNLDGLTILRDVSDYPVPSVPTGSVSVGGDLLLTATTYRLAQLQNSVEIFANALGHCQLGLFTTVTPGTTVPDSCAAFA